MFKFKGISNIEMGLIPIEEDFLKRAPIRYEEIQIEGKNGSIYNELGVSDVVSSFDAQLIYDNVDDIFSWLSGIGEFEYQGRTSIMRFYDVAEALRTSSIKKIKFNYIRSPFWHKANDKFEKCTNKIINLGNTTSNPILLLEGTGKCSVEINGSSFSYSFDTDRVVYIDCEEKTESYDGKSKSRNITIGYEYPSLNPGINTLKTTGTLTVSVKRKDAWK